MPEAAEQTKSSHGSPGARAAHPGSSTFPDTCKDTPLSPGLQARVGTSVSAGSSDKHDTRWPRGPELAVSITVLRLEWKRFK